MRTYFMTGRTLELFCERYVSWWSCFHSTPPPETPFLTETHFDRIARGERVFDVEDFAAHVLAKVEERGRLAELREGQARRDETARLQVAPDRLAGLLLLPGGGVVAKLGDGSASVSWEDSRHGLLPREDVPLNDELAAAGVRLPLRREVSEWIGKRGR